MCRKKLNPPSEKKQITMTEVMVQSYSDYNGIVLEHIVVKQKTVVVLDRVCVLKDRNFKSQVMVRIKA